jgi:ATP-binding cassette subfamily B protein
MKNILSIVKLSKPLHGKFVLMSILILLYAVFQQVLPVTSKYVIDDFIEQLDNSSFSIPFTLIGIALCAQATSLLVNAISMRLGDHISGELKKFLVESFYKHTLSLPQKYFDNELSGKIINQLNRGIFTIESFVNTATNFILPSIFQAAFTLAILTYTNIWIGVLSITVFPIFIGISAYSTKKWGEKEKVKNPIEDKARGRVQEVISSIKLVKVLSTQLSEIQFVSNAYTEINKIYAQQSRMYHILNFLRNATLEVIILLILGIALYQGYHKVLTIGDIFLIVQLLAMLQRPLFGMSFILERVQQAEAGSAEFFEVLSLESEESFEEATTTSALEKSLIVLSNVSFAYEDETVLKNLTCTLKAPQTVALVGHSGAGKSTIANLLLRLYSPAAGSISINGEDYSKLSHREIRSNFSLVFQNSMLFSSTIRENVAYSLKDVPDEIIKDALKKAYALEFVEKLKDGLDARIGEKGVKLSGGQKQRIQIARAILQNRPIIILDEATSSLDARSEVLVQEALDTLFKERLVIIIAHRFSTLQNADRIIVLDNGAIVDDGKPTELATKAGIYKDLLDYQIEGNKKLLAKYELY